MNLLTARWLIGAGFVFSISGCIGAAAPPTQSSTATKHSTSSNVHLYVVDSLNGKIYRYSVANGLPETSPEEVFATVPGARFLGVDGAQNIYAAGSNASTGFVEKFASDGTLLGNAQLGVTVDAFATDSDGYLFVVPGNDQGQVYTFAPSAIGSGSVAQPIATLTGKHRSIFYFGATPGLAIDGRAPLYKASSLWIDVFDHPRRTSHESSTIARPRLGWAPYLDGAVALDESRRLYANVGFGDTCEGPPRSCQSYYWHLTDFEALSPNLERGKAQIIRARNCFYAGSNGASSDARPFSGSYYYRSSGFVTGMAVYGGYIDAACTGDLSAVWIYRANDFAHQKPLEVLTGPTIPTDAKIGP